jgi:hypothetical protein
MLLEETCRDCRPGHRLSRSIAVGTSIGHRGSNNKWQLWSTVRVRDQKGPRHEQRLPSDLVRGNSELKIERPNERKQDRLHPGLFPKVNM